MAVRAATPNYQVNGVEWSAAPRHTALPDGSCLKLRSQVAHATFSGFGSGHLGCSVLQLFVAHSQRGPRLGQRLFQCSDGLLCPSPFEPPSQKVRDRRAETHALLSGMRI